MFWDRDLHNANEKSIINTIFTFIIMTMPIINNYASPIPAVGLSEFVLLLFMPFMLLSILLHHKKVALHGYWVFFFYGAVVSLIILIFNSEFSLSEVGKRLLRDAFYVFLIFLFAQKFFDVKFALELYKKLTIFTCTYLILQCISFYIFHYTLPWVIPGLEFNFSNRDMESYFQHYVAMYQYIFRPTSVFVEPAQFAHFVAPYLILTLFSLNRLEKQDYILAIFVSISMLLSTSANAYVFMLVIWALWYIFSLIGVQKHNNVAVLFGAGVFAVIVLFFLNSYSNIFDAVISRFDNIGNGVSGSTNVRLLRGVYLFDALDPIYQILGIGFGSFSDFSSSYSITTMYDTKTEYMNSISYILVSSGITGLLIYLFTLYKISNMGILTVKMLILLLLVMSISSSVYSTPIYVIILSFALYLPKSNVNKQPCSAMS
jgi:hypothetical protein